MIEKRFTIKEFSTLDAMSSLDVICDNGIELPSSTACDLLNELNDENEKFKKALIELKEIGDYQYSRIKELSDENEQLKQRINVLDAQITAQGIVIEGYQNRNQKLFDEIEQLKEGNQRLIKMLDNVANYMQKEHRDIPLDDFVEWWNKMATEGLENE